MTRLPARKRPHFRFDRQIISAAGLIIYDKKNYRFLLQSKRGKWDMFGGKVEKEDATIFHTIERETIEESNGIISDIDFQKCDYHLVRNAKYLIAIISIDDIEIDENLENYDKIEYHTNTKRSVEWVSILWLSKLTAKGALSDYVSLLGSTISMKNVIKFKKIIPVKKQIERKRWIKNVINIPVKKQIERKRWIKKQ